jgi:hypothetical protein
MSMNPLQFLQSGRVATWQNLPVCLAALLRRNASDVSHLPSKAPGRAAHMGHPDFRVDKRIFASLHSGDQFGMVKLTPDQQAAFLEDHPAAFVPESGAWGRSGCTRVILKAISEDILGEALTLAWRNTRKAQRKKCR